MCNQISKAVVCGSDHGTWLLERRLPPAVLRNTFTGFPLFFLT